MAQGRPKTIPGLNFKLKKVIHVKSLLLQLRLAHSYDLTKVERLPGRGLPVLGYARDVLGTLDFSFFNKAMSPNTGPMASSI